MNEILLYGDIYSYSASEFIRQFSEVEGDTLTIRVNTNGGDPQMAFGMAAKFLEFEGKKLVKVDGKAYSSGLFFVAYADEVEALDVSEFLIHRATWGEWFEQSPQFTEEVRASLERVNKSLETAFRNKIDVKLFEQIKGVKVSEIFSMDSRINVFLSAKEAKQIGLVDRIVNITPKKKAQINALMFDMAAKGSGVELPSNIEGSGGQKPDKQVITNTKINMNLEQLKAEHPELFAQVLAMGVTNERDRVGAWMKFVDADAKAVADGISSGEALTQTAMADFTMKIITASKLGDLSAEGAVIKTETEKVEGEKEELTAAENLKAQVMGGLGLKSENK